MIRIHYTDEAIAKEILVNMVAMFSYFTVFTNIGKEK